MMIRVAIVAVSLAILSVACAEPSPAESDHDVGANLDAIAVDWNTASSECTTFDVPEGWTCFPGGRFEFGAGECRGPTGAWVTLQPFIVRHDVVSSAEWESLMPDVLNTDPGCEPGGFGTYHCAHWAEALLYANRVSAEEGRTSCYDFSAASCRFAPATLSEYETVQTYACLAPELVERVAGCDGYRIPTAAEKEWIFTAAGTFDPGMIPSWVPERYPAGLPFAVSGRDTWVFDRFVGAEHGETDRFIPAGDYADPVVHEIWREVQDPVRESPRAVAVVSRSREDANDCLDYTQLLAGGVLFRDRRVDAGFAGWTIQLVRTLTEADRVEPSVD